MEPRERRSGRLVDQRAVNPSRGRCGNERATAGSAADRRAAGSETNRKGGASVANGERGERPGRKREPAAGGRNGRRADDRRVPPHPEGRQGDTRGARRGEPEPDRKPAVGGKRHQGRMLALQLLYEVDLTGHDPDDVLARTFAEQPAPAAVRAHVERLVRGVLAGHEEIDPYIAAAAPAFPLAQLPAIDRNVLRLAVFELLHEPAVPPKAAINEAVELAKRFGGENSGRFVNGVLGTIVERIPRPATGDAAEATSAAP